MRARPARTPWPQSRRFLDCLTGGPHALLAQDLNPLPFTTLTANCVGWVAYSFVTDDALVYWPNALGFLLGMFYTFSCYGLAGAAGRLQCGGGRAGGQPSPCMCCGVHACPHRTAEAMLPWAVLPLYSLEGTLCSNVAGADTKTRDRQLAIVLFFSVVLMVVGAVGTLGDLSQDDLKLLWGYTSNGARGAGQG